MNDILQSGCYEYPLQHKKVDWFVDDVTKLENKIKLFFKHTKKDIIMTEKDEEHYGIHNISRFREKEVGSDKVKDHCHLTGKYSGPAHNRCIINVKQKQSNFIPFVSQLQ